MAVRLIPILQQVIDATNVQIGIGYKLYTYATGTTTPKATYSDEALTIEQTNPLEVNSDGYFASSDNSSDTNIWVSDKSLYKIILTDSDDVEVASFDPVDGETNSLTNFDPMPTVFLGTTSGDGSAYTLEGDPALTEYLDTQTFLVTFHIASEADATLDIDSLGALNLQKFDDDGDLVNIDANDINTGQTYLLKNTGTSFAVIDIQSRLATASISGTQYLSSFIIISNNGTDGDHDIDFSAGTFNFSDGSGQAILSSVLTKQIDAAWAAGNNAGGLFTGTVAANTWYHCFAIYNPTTGISDAGFDTSITAANIPSGYTKYNYRGSILTNSSANILPYSQMGNEFYFATAINNFSSTAPNTSTNLSVSVPPDLEMIAILEVASSIEGASCFIRFIKPTFPDATPTVLNSQYQVASSDTTNVATSLVFRVSTNSSQQVAWRASISGVATTVNTWGFVIPINYLI